MSELHTLSLLEARQKMLTGEICAEGLLEVCLRRIEVTEPQIKALLARRDEAALAEARALDMSVGKSGGMSVGQSGGKSGDISGAAGNCQAQPLRGIPVIIKDNLALRGLPTTAASKILEKFIPPYNAYVVEKLQAAGAIIVGKSNLDEFAMGSSTENSAFQVTRNPWNLDKVPGGSSGGSAASVAACQAFAALGSDTGGSIRQPASLCGCVGLKPTYGRVSRYGLFAYGSSLDQIGPMARAVADLALVMQVIAGHDERDSTCSPLPVPDYSAALQRENLSGLRVGIPRQFMEMPALDPEVRQAWENTIYLAKQLGAELVDVAMPHAEFATPAYYIIAMAEAGSNLARYDGVRYGHRAADVRDLEEMYTRSRTEGFGPEVQRRILLGSYVLSSGYYDAYYRKAAQIRRLVRQDYEDALTRCDFLLTPVSPIPAWDVGSVSDPLQMYLMDIFTLPLNMAGLPGLSIPVGFCGGNLPIGMQLMGRPFDEAGLLAAGNVLTLSLGTAGQYAPL